MTVGEAAEILDGEEDGSNRPRTADSGIFARRLPDGTALMRDEELAKAFRTLVENWTNQSITFHESTEQVRGIKTTAAASTHKRLSPSDINPIRAALDIAEAMLVLSGKDGWNHTDRAAARVIESIRLLRPATAIRSEALTEEELETHADLAIAYAQMGLLTDALQEAALVISKGAGTTASASALDLLFSDHVAHPGAMDELRRRLFPS